MDNYDEQLAELFLSDNAHLYKGHSKVQQESISEHLQRHYGRKAAWTKGSWVYFPWSGQLVHVLEETLFSRLRTTRNRELMTDKEQRRYGELKAGVLGMSVGSSAAVALSIQGGSNDMKIGDGAVISGSNLNRVRTGVASVGLSKEVIIARQIYEMNPYAKVVRAGSVNRTSLTGFLRKPWKLDVVVDEMDDLEMKIRMRVAARRYRIPVLMATDLGDDVMLDVERFDKDSSLPLFHGRAGSIENVLTVKNLPHQKWLKYATQIIGPENVPLRMQQSLLKVGAELPTHPQLGGTAMMAGAVIAYAARQLALGGKLKSGRMKVSLDRDLLEGHASFGNRRRHRRHTRILDKAMDSI